MFVQAHLVKSQQQLDDVRSAVGEATAERSRIQREVDEASAPQSIIERAEVLGMIPPGQPTHIKSVRPIEEASTTQAEEASLG